MIPILGRRRRRYESGFSLIESLVAVAIMGIVSAAVASMFVTMQSENRALAENLAARDLTQSLLRSLGDGNVCQYLLTKPVALTFDSTQVAAGKPQKMTPSLPLYASYNAGVPGPIVAQIGAPASAYARSLVINSIDLQIDAVAGGTYTGHWMIGFDNTKTVHPVKAVSITASLTADTTVPTAALPTSCNSGASSLHQNSCIELNWGSKNGGGPTVAQYMGHPVPALPVPLFPPDKAAWAVCPVGFYVAGVVGTGVATGSKADFGRIICCPP